MECRGPSTRSRLLLQPIPRTIPILPRQSRECVCVCHALFRVSLGFPYKSFPSMTCPYIFLQCPPISTRQYKGPARVFPRAPPILPSILLSIPLWSRRFFRPFSYSFNRSDMAFPDFPLQGSSVEDTTTLLWSDSPLFIVRFLFSTVPRGDSISFYISSASWHSIEVPKCYIFEGQVDSATDSSMFGVSSQVRPVDTEQDPAF